MAGLVTGMCLFTGSKFAEMGHAVEGASVITVNIVGLATVFIVGRAMQKSERENKVGLQTGKTQKEQERIQK